MSKISNDSTAKFSPLHARELRHTVEDFLRRHPKITIGKLAKMCNLSRVTMSKIINDPDYGGRVSVATYNEIMSICHEYVPTPRSP